VKSFFDAIILISCFTALFLFYYSLKKWLKSYRKKRREKYYSSIIKNEKQAQNRRALQVALAKMKSDQAFWAEIYIHSGINERFRLEHQAGTTEWHFLFRHRMLNRDIQTDLAKYGDIIYTNNIITGVQCTDSEKLLNCVFYFFDQIFHIDENTEIILKY
jgi:hypothetical protein